METIQGNVRTMEFIGRDDWDMPVYKCIENGILWKDLEHGKSDIPELCSCGNEFDGEPDSPIRKDLEIVYKSKYKESPYRFNYMMLSRLQMDCNAHLGISNREFDASRRKEIIEEMKELYNSFPESEKPEWLTYEEILEYEKLMVEN
jgi:hypothetical protein